LYVFDCDTGEQHPFCVQAEVSIHHTNVLQLELDNCNCKACRVHVQCPRLQRLSLINLSARSLLVTTPMITHLALINMPEEWTAQDAVRSVARFSTLRELDLTGSRSLWDSTLRKVG
jgi:hypothetical protein